MQPTLLKYENMKLKKQFIFNLPVSKEICGRICPGCYALKAQVRFPKTVLPYRERMHQASLQPDFAQKIIAELTNTKRKPVAVRAHESGEFYSQAYIDSWHTIASALPHISFYAFTKRMKHFDFSTLMALPNFVIIDSLMHGGLNYAPLDKLNQSIPICPATTSAKAQCGIDCNYCWTKQAQADGIQFVQH